MHQLAEVNESPRIKLSEDLDKVTMPGRKDAYRLFGADGHALVDLLQQPNEPPVIQGTRVLCRHPFQVYLVVSGHVLYLLLSIFFWFFWHCLFKWFLGTYFILSYESRQYDSWQGIGLVLCVYLFVALFVGRITGETVTAVVTKLSD